MVAAGGFIAAHAFAPERQLAEAYAAAMQAKVFGPVGMASTTLDFATVARGDHAVPHALAIDGATRAMPLAIERGVEPIAPAGGVWTTLRDMERYVATELGNGVTPEGVRVVSAASMRDPPFAGGAFVVDPGPSLLIPGYPGYRFTRILVDRPGTVR